MVSLTVHLVYLQAVLQLACGKCLFYLVVDFFTWCHLKDVLALLYPYWTSLEFYIWTLFHCWDFFIVLFLFYITYGRLFSVFISDIYVGPLGIYLYYITPICSAVHVYLLSY